MLFTRFSNLTFIYKMSNWLREVYIYVCSTLPLAKVHVLVFIVLFTYLDLLFISVSSDFSH